MRTSASLVARVAASSTSTARWCAPWMRRTCCRPSSRSWSGSRPKTPPSRRGERRLGWERSSPAFSLATVALGYALARRLLPPLGALLAAFLLAVEPGLVLLGRLAVPEAALAPMLLLTILLVTPWVPETAAQGSAGVGPAPGQAPT